MSNESENTPEIQEDTPTLLHGGLQYYHNTDSQNEENDYYVENEIEEEGYTGDSMEAVIEYKRKYDEEQKQKAIEQAKQTTTKDSPNKSSSGSWIMPVNAGVSSPYGWRVHPIKKIKIYHNGVDFAANKGTPIKASMGGIVTFAEYQGANGNCVRINNGIIDGKFVTSTYIHLNTISVTKGQKVEQGRIIGTVGSTGKYPNGQPSSTGPHLHLSIYKNGQPVNPFKYIK